MATYMFEVYYAPPTNPDREARIMAGVAKFGGRLDYREEPDAHQKSSICLTYEFDDFEQAQIAASELRQQGEYVEGPGHYSD